MQQKLKTDENKWKKKDLNEFKSVLMSLKTKTVQDSKKWILLLATSNIMEINQNCKIIIAKN